MGKEPQEAASGGDWPGLSEHMAFPALLGAHRFISERERKKEKSAWSHQMREVQPGQESPHLWLGFRLVGCILEGVRTFSSVQAEPDPLVFQGIGEEVSRGLQGKGTTLGRGVPTEGPMPHGEAL